MIEGTVNANLEAVVVIPLRGPGGRTQELEAVVDTGFNGYITITPRLAAELELPLVGKMRVVLADGREETFDAHDVTVIWDGQSRYVDTYVVDATPLVGMALLHGHGLYVEVAEGGRVVIEGMG